MDDNALQMAAEPKQLQELNWASTTKDEQKGRTKMKKPGVYCFLGSSPTE